MRGPPARARRVRERRPPVRRAAAGAVRARAARGRRARARDGHRDGAPRHRRSTRAGSISAGRCGSSPAAARSSRSTAARRPGDARDFIARVPADVLVELDDRSTRAPASRRSSHVRQALRRGLHVITANKGPVAFALRPLRAPRRAHAPAVPPRGRGDGRDARLQPRRALPARRARSSRSAARSTPPRTSCSRAWRRA